MLTFDRVMPEAEYGDGTIQYHMFFLPHRFQFRAVNQNFDSCLYVEGGDTEVLYQATDADGDRDQERFNITITFGHPTVEIDTADQTVAAGTVVVLNATTTGQDLTYLWEDSPADGVFGSIITEDTNWTAPDSDEDYVISLTITDSLLRTASSSITITVTAGPIVAITTLPQTVIPGGRVILNATTDGVGLIFAWSASPDAGNFGDDYRRRYVLGCAACRRFLYAGTACHGQSGTHCHR